MKQYALLFALFLGQLIVAAQETPFVNGELIVKLSPGERPDGLVNKFQYFEGHTIGMRCPRVLSDNLNIYLFSFAHQNINQEALLNAVRGTVGVEIAQFNHTVQERAIPNDPLFASQWHHADASDNDIDSDLAWDITVGGTTANGDEIVVCVIEGGGSNYNHTDLIANHWTNPGEIENNGIDDDGNGYVDDYHGWNPVNDNDNILAGGHGTAVSGMIGARGNNSIGGSGVNQIVKIMQVMVGNLTEANVIEAYEYAYDMRNLYNSTGGSSGAFVVATNASWGIDNANPANYPVWCAYYDALGQIGILNCGATANNNVNIDVVGDMPTGCASDFMVSVTATNSSDLRTFSGYGVNSIDLGAPGESVYLPSGAVNYSFTSGTSFASPCVAGAIALLYSAPCADLAALALSDPEQAAFLVRQYIFDGVDPVANLAAEVATGGRLNVHNSLNLLLDNCGPLAPCTATGIELSTHCFYNLPSGDVEAFIDIEVQLGANYCDVQEVCWTESGNGNFTCINLPGAGIEANNNNNVVTLTGLASNTSYDVYYTTADGVSETATIATGDCAALVPGCTAPEAINYNASANFDDGSCDYPCVEVNLSILTDCWGEEVSWQITDSEGAVVASSPANSYADQTTYNWTSCLESGCYTFTIFDSFGDGMAGAIYNFCGVNGNYGAADEYGNQLFQMGNANYGLQASHAFCVEWVDLTGCTDPDACNYMPGAQTDDGSCEFLSCLGCTDPDADNFDPGATVDDGSCTFSCEQVTVSITTDCFPGETFWSLSDEFGNILASAGIGAYTLAYTTYTSVICLDEGCYVFNLGDDFGDGLGGVAFGCLANGAYSVTDGDGNALVAMGPADFGNFVSYEFCVEGGALAGCTDPGACNYISDAQTDDGSCEYNSCQGCTNPYADNYDPAATLDNGSCIFSCELVTVSITTDCYPAETFWSLTDDFGNVLASASIGAYTLAYTTYVTTLCLDEGCYVFNLGDDFGDGLAGMDAGCLANGSYSITDSEGNALVAMGPANFGDLISHDFCVEGITPGCMDPFACNFLQGAQIDDGSCEYLSCQGCTSSEADNYDPSATVDDGSCVFSCEQVTVSITTDCFPAETFWSLSDEFGNTLASSDLGDYTIGNYTYTSVNCLDAGCYVFSIGDEFGDGMAGQQYGCGANGSYTVYDSNGNELVTMGPANFGDLISHDFCIEDAVACPGDFNGDQLVNVADLLILLSDFGCTINCATDMNGDGIISSGDLLNFLPFYAVNCE